MLARLIILFTAFNSLCWFSPTQLFAIDSVVFTGFPEIKISEGGINRVPEAISKEKAIEYRCVISKVGDKYYWTTRENVQMTPIDSGAFITFLAINGSGYVRIVKSEKKEVVKQVGALGGDPETRYTYVEHLLLGLKSITYYGRNNSNSALRISF